MSSWGIFCPFTPLTSQKIKISKKWKKTPGYIIILHNCTKNYDYRLYCSWDMACDRCKCYFSFWAVLYTFITPTAQKMKISKKWKKISWDINILHKCTKNHDYMLYCSWDMAHGRCNCCFSFWAIFCTFTPLTAQKMATSQKWKKLEISSFYTIVPKIMIIVYTVTEIRGMMDVIVIFHFGLLFALLPP